MENWSFGVMGENRTDEYNPYYQAHRAMILRLLKMIG